MDVHHRLDAGNAIWRCKTSHLMTNDRYNNLCLQSLSCAVSLRNVPMMVAALVVGRVSGLLFACIESLGGPDPTSAPVYPISCEWNLFHANG